MRARQRSSSRPGERTRLPPARSRVTVRRPGAPLVRSGLSAALRSSRQALSELTGELDALLALLRDPAVIPDATAAERLRGAARHAGSAFASLGTLARRR